MLDELKRVAPAMLEEWAITKKAPQHAAWLHSGDKFVSAPHSTGEKI